MPNAFANSNELKRAKAAVKKLSKDKDVPKQLIVALQNLIAKYDNFGPDKQYAGDGEWVTTDISIPQRNLEDLLDIVEFLVNNARIIPHKYGSLQKLARIISEHDENTSFATNDMNATLVTLSMRPYATLPPEFSYIEAINILSSPKSFASATFADSAKRCFGNFESFFYPKDRLTVASKSTARSMSGTTDSPTDIANDNLRLYVNILKYLQDNPRLLRGKKKWSVIVYLEDIFRNQNIYEVRLARSKNDARNNLEPMTLERLASALGIPEHTNHGAYNYISIVAAKPLAEQYPATSTLSRLWESFVAFVRNLFSNPTPSVSIEAKVNTTKHTPLSIDTTEASTTHRSLAQRVIANVRQLFTPHATTATKEKTIRETPESTNQSKLNKKN